MGSVRRDFMFVNCEVKHEWVSAGGKCAMCCDTCSCSVPVYKCAVCGDYDYGDNDEAIETKRYCAELNAVAFEEIRIADALNKGDGVCEKGG